MIGYLYYNENLFYGYCILEVMEDSEECDNSSNIFFFGFYNEINSKKINFYFLDKF